MAGHYNKESTDCQCVSLATKKQPTMPLSRQGLSSWLGSLHSRPTIQHLYNLEAYLI